MISIVIPNYFMNKPGKIVPDGDEELWFAEHCFEQLAKHTKLPYELILIDNGSVHGHELLEKWADKLIVNKENLGFAKSCNQGFKVAVGEWVVCMNNDIFVYDGWVEALIQAFEDLSDCGVAMPALMKQTKDGRKALQIEEPDLSQNYNEYGRDAEFGSCWLIKKEFLEEIRKATIDEKNPEGYYFDENFKVGFGEDRDLWRRVRQLNKHTYRTHKTRVFHQGNVTMGKIENRKQYTLPNREYLKEKWGY